MLIASYFKRPNAPVELANDDGSFTRYFFRPLGSNAPHAEHVASVENPAHIARLLSITEGYYPATDAEATLRAATAVAAQTAKPSAPPPSPETPVPEATSTPEPTPAAPPAAKATPTGPDAAEVAALLALKPAAFREALAKSAPAVLQAALEAEQGKGDDERATYTKALRAQLGVN